MRNGGGFMGRRVTMVKGRYNNHPLKGVIDRDSYFNLIRESRPRLRRRRLRMRVKGVPRTRGNNEGR